MSKYLREGRDDLRSKLAVGKFLRFRRGNGLPYLVGEAVEFLPHGRPAHTARIEAIDALPGDPHVEVPLEDLAGVFERIGDEPGDVPVIDIFDQLEGWPSAGILTTRRSPIRFDNRVVEAVGIRAFLPREVNKIVLTLCDGQIQQSMLADDLCYGWEHQFRLSHIYVPLRRPAPVSLNEKGKVTLG